MDNFKKVRWKQRFDNFSRSYKLLKKYSKEPLVTELEIAGIIQFFEVTFELSWKLLKDYLEVEGYIVKSPRETVKKAFQMELIDNGHVWMDALSSRNLTTHTYDEEFARKLVSEIIDKYLPELDKIYEKLLMEI